MFHHCLCWRSRWSQSRSRRRGPAAAVPASTASGTATSRQRPRQAERIGDQPHRQRSEPAGHSRRRCSASPRPNCGRAGCRTAGPAAAGTTWPWPRSARPGWPAWRAPPARAGRPGRAARPPAALTRSTVRSATRSRTTTSAASPASPEPNRTAMASAATAGRRCATSTRYSARNPVSTSTSRSATCSSTSQRTAEAFRSAASTSRARAVHAGPVRPAGLPRPVRRRSLCRANRAAQRGPAGRCRARRPPPPGQDQVSVPPAAPGGQDRGEQQRPGYRAGRSGQVPAGHDLRLPVRPGVHQLGLGQRDERAGGRIEQRERRQQHGERPGAGHGEQSEDEQDAAAEHGQAAPPPGTGQYPQRQLERPARQQRHGREQADLRVAQVQVATDQRQRGALGAVN